MVSWVLRVMIHKNIQIKVKDETVKFVTPRVRHAKVERAPAAKMISP